MSICTYVHNSKKEKKNTRVKQISTANYRRFISKVKITPFIYCTLYALQIIMPFSSLDILLL